MNFMHMRWAAAGLPALAAIATMLVMPGFAQDKRWAAVDANNEASAPVAWAGSEPQARQRATEACEKVSKTCASSPASTDELDDVFAVMCCTRPRAGCAISVSGSRADALKQVQKTFTDAGYSNCNLRHYISPATGKKQ
jgi:hypothetical protein